MDYFSNQIQSSMTPYILEEREMRATQMDIFSRLMRDRLLWVAGGVLLVGAVAAAASLLLRRRGR